MQNLALADCSCECAKSSQLNSLPRQHDKLMLNGVPTPSILFVRQPRQHVYALTGDQVVFACCVYDNASVSASVRSAGQLRELSYAWRYNDAPLKLVASGSEKDVGHRMALVNGSHLRVSSVKPSDSGRYVCLVENDMGSIRSITSNLHISG